MSQLSNTPSEPRARSLYDRGRARLRKRDRALAIAVTLGVHLLAVLALVAALPQARSTFEPEAVTVGLTSLPPEPAPETAARPAPAKARAERSARTIARARPRPTQPTPRRPVSRTPRPDALPPGEGPPAPTTELTDAELEGAITAESGRGGGGSGPGGGRGCDMARLRHGAAAAERAPARRPGPDGKGLAGVRQAIMVEVVFAPEACRSDPVHGIVLISLNDVPGAARLALGSGSWRWSDLLFARNAPMPR
jgi:hypothetical protein